MVLVHVVAVQTIGDLEPQRVARAEAAGCRTFGHQRVPQLARAAGGDEDLESVLAGVAGSRDDAAGDAGHGRIAEVVVREVDHFRLAELVDERGRLRSLDGDLRPVVGALLDPRAFRVILHPGEVFFAPAGVDTDEQAGGRIPVDDDVVDHAALLVAERAVLRLAVGALREIVRHQPLGGFERSRAIDGHLAHVADVEDADPLADGGVLLEDTLVLHRHVPTGELDDASSGREMRFIQWCTQGHGVREASGVMRGAQA